MLLLQALLIRKRPEPLRAHPQQQQQLQEQQAQHKQKHRLRLQAPPKLLQAAQPKQRQTAAASNRSSSHTRPLQEQQTHNRGSSRHPGLLHSQLLAQKLHPAAHGDARLLLVHGASLPLLHHSRQLLSRPHPSKP
jgi:hypothetical protein